MGGPAGTGKTDTAGTGGGGGFLAGGGGGGFLAGDGVGAGAGVAAPGMIFGMAVACPADPGKAARGSTSILCSGSVLPNTDAKSPGTDAGRAAGRGRRCSGAGFTGRAFATGP